MTAAAERQPLKGAFEVKRGTWQVTTLTACARSVLTEAGPEQDDSSCVRAFHFSPAPFGHWSFLIDLRTRLRIDYCQSRTPLQIPNKR